MATQIVSRGLAERCLVEAGKSARIGEAKLIGNVRDGSRCLAHKQGLPCRLKPRLTDRHGWRSIAELPEAELQAAHTAPACIRHVMQCYWFTDMRTDIFFRSANAARHGWPRRAGQPVRVIMGMRSQQTVNQ